MYCVQNKKIQTYNNVRLYQTKINEVKRAKKINQAATYPCKLNTYSV